MLNILIGLISGIVSAMGFGGGTILILGLNMIACKDQHIAQGANLVFFIPSAIIAIAMNLKEKLIKIKTGMVVSIFGIIGAIIGTRIAINIEGNRLKLYFGIFLLFIAIFEIYSEAKVD